MPGNPQLPRNLVHQNGTVALPHVREGVRGSLPSADPPGGDFSQGADGGGSCSYVCEEGACPMLRASGSLIMSFGNGWEPCVSIQILGPQVGLHRGA